MSSAIDLSVAEARSISARASRALGTTRKPGAVMHLERIRDSADRLAAQLEKMSATAQEAFHEANP